MIIARFMEVSLGYARIQVNTLRCVNDDKGLEKLNTIARH
jgi:hypothetical protein